MNPDHGQEAYRPGRLALATTWAGSAACLGVNLVLALSAVEEALAEQYLSTDDAAQLIGSSAGAAFFAGTLGFTHMLLRDKIAESRQASKGSL